MADKIEKTLHAAKRLEYLKFIDGKATDGAGAYVRVSEIRQALNLSDADFGTIQDRLFREGLIDAVAEDRQEVCLTIKGTAELQRASVASIAPVKKAAHRIFISHAVNDKPVVDKIVDLLHLTLDISKDDIFCSCVPGFGIPLTEEFINHIKTTLVDSEIVICVFSANYFCSQFCACEMGAAWALNKRAFYLLIPGTEFSDVKAVAAGVQAAKLDDSAAMTEFGQALCDRLDIKKRDVRWEIKKGEFISSLPDQVKSILPPHTIDFSAHQELKAKLAETVEELTIAYKDLEKLKKLNADMVAGGTPAGAIKIWNESRPERERLQEFCDTVKEGLKRTSSIVKEVMYQHQKGGMYEGESAGLQKAIDNGFLLQERDGGVTPNLGDPTMKRIDEAIRELDGFIQRMSPEYYDAFVEENAFQPDLSNKRFWNKYLSPTMYF